MNILKNRYVRTFLIFALFLVVVYFGLNSVEESGERLQQKALQDAIARGCTHSYATTGAYPQSLDALVDNYGVQIDHSKYIVHYEVFASNIMPDITVIQK